MRQAKAAVNDEEKTPKSSSQAGSDGASQKSQVARPSAPEPDEEYDPTKPNDYDEYCRRRMRQKAEEEIERRRQADAERRKAAQMAKPEAPKEDDVATKMLKKMGWKEGEGLGKDGQGMATPLVLKKTDQRQGSIVE